MTGSSCGSSSDTCGSSSHVLQRVEIRKGLQTFQLFQRIVARTRSSPGKEIGKKPGCPDLGMPERKVRTKQTRLSRLEWVPVLLGTRLDVAGIFWETSMCMSDHHKLFPCKIWTRTPSTSSVRTPKKSRTRTTSSMRHPRWWFISCSSLFPPFCGCYYFLLLPLVSASSVRLRECFVCCQHMSSWVHEL